MTANTPQRVDVERLRELLARAGVESGAPFEAFAGEVLGRDGDCLLGCYSNAAHGYDARSTADLIAATLNALPALLHQLAEREAEIEQARRTADYWKAEHLTGNEVVAELRRVSKQGDEVMHALHAEAREWRTRAEAAERAREECASVLREALRGWDDLIEDLELNGLHDDPRFNYRRQKEWIGKVEAKAGAAFLAANGGRDHA